MSKKNDWKKREGIVYSTASEFEYQHEDHPQDQTPSPDRQLLKVSLDKNNRGGKQVTVVSGFVGTQEDLTELSKVLKTKCGVGGSAKDGNILVQGDLRDKVVTILSNAGYRAKRSG